MDSPNSPFGREVMRPAVRDGVLSVHMVHKAIDRDKRLSLREGDGFSPTPCAPAHIIHRALTLIAEIGRAPVAVTLLTLDNRMHALNDFGCADEECDSVQSRKLRRAAHVLAQA
jgi:hypothetical protein